MEHHQKPPTTDIEAAQSATAEEELRERLRSLHVFDCQLPEFDPDSVPTKPIELVRSWLIGAIDADAREPHAMTLSTVDTDGRPSSRVLILKGLSDERLQFASSRGSRKGRELSATPWAAANFYWPELGRQVRLTGRVLDGGPDDGAGDFLARGLESRVESLTGRQSEVLRDRADLDAALTEARARLRPDPALVPDHWALYQLEPNEIEFWQADRDRRHIRLRYTLDDGLDPIAALALTRRQPPAAVDTRVIPSAPPPTSRKAARSSHPTSSSVRSRAPLLERLTGRRSVPSRDRCTEQ